MGTLARDRKGGPLGYLRMTVDESPPPPPQGTAMVGPAYKFEPGGATFSRPVTLTWQYNPADIPEGADGKDLLIAFWDEVGSQWVQLDGLKIGPASYTVDVAISHFSSFALICRKPAAFLPGSLSIVPREVKPGDSVMVSVLVSNTGGVAGSYEVSLRLDGVVTARKMVRLDAGAGETVSFSITEARAGIHTLDVNGRQATFEVKIPPAPPAFTVSALAVSPEEVNTGESAVITITVANTGDLEGTYRATYQINEVEAGSKEVTVAGRSRQVVTFNASQTTPGTYVVSAGGLKRPLVVKEKTPPPAEPEPAAAPEKELPPAPPVEPARETSSINWWSISLLAGIIAAGALAFRLMSGKKRG